MMVEGFKDKWVKEEGWLNIKWDIKLLTIKFSLFFFNCRVQGL